ncbi:DUF7014 domain-containing protein [Vibrio sp. 10N.261.51.C6]|uniref:DUF7014 domain-containing protein n=1 Tax=Vibrio sp. 10N.261.51.C6 TaxID=3229676 RepID=UPI003553CCC2
MFNFNVFSRRQKQNLNTRKDLKPLNPEFRNRFFMMLQQENWGVSIQQLVEETRQKMMMNLGRGIGNSNGSAFYDYTSDMFEFLFSCPDEHFLDALEFMLETQSGRGLVGNKHFVERINQLFDLDDLPYKVTLGRIDSTEGRNEQGYTTVSYDFTYPKVIRKDSEVLNQLAIEPALLLLNRPELSNANTEFLSALEDYRHGKFRDSVTKCCSAFESVMKVECKRRGIHLSGKEAANSLVINLIKDTGMPTFFEQPIMLIATIRNRLGIAHGSGDEDKQVSESIALYSINATASAMLLVTGDS